MFKKFLFILALLVVFARAFDNPDDTMGCYTNYCADEIAMCENDSGCKKSTSCANKCSGSTDQNCMISCFDDNNSIFAGDVMECLYKNCIH